MTLPVFLLYLVSKFVNDAQTGWQGVDSQVLPTAESQEILLEWKSTKIKTEKINEIKQ